MDIRIGGVPPVGSPSGKTDSPAGAIEAKVLSVREPRRGAAGSIGQERRQGTDPKDPLGGRVLVLLVPDGSILPAGLDEGRYRVFLRLVKR